MRKLLLALGAALALTMSVPTVASAAHFHWGHVHHGFWGPRIGFSFGVAPYAYASCSAVHRVWTPFGWRWHRVWVC